MIKKLQICRSDFWSILYLFVENRERRTINRTVGSFGPFLDRSGGPFGPFPWQRSRNSNLTFGKFFLLRNASNSLEIVAFFFFDRTSTWSATVVPTFETISRRPCDDWNSNANDVKILPPIVLSNVFVRFESANFRSWVYVPSIKL